jgi:phosphatidylglycerol:prolipoprotein diacylglycerol transferase
MFPTLFKSGSFELPSFGLLMVIAFFSGLFLAQKRAPRFGLTSEDVIDSFLPMLFAGVLGARVVFIAQEWGYYKDHMSELLTLRFQGLTSFGGILFGLIACMIWCKRKGFSFPLYGDLIAPAFLLGHAIGRVGCFLNGCCFGGVCPPSFPLGVKFVGQELLHHPAQLYDTAMNLVGLAVLLAYEKRPHSPGQTFGLMFILHGMARFIYEFWRAGTVEDVAAGKASSTYMASLPITEAQVAALVLVVIGAVLMAVFGRKGMIQQELRTA